MNYCAYYQAQIPTNRTHFFVALLRSHEHLCFDRTLTQSPNVQLFEFFVPVGKQKEFEAIMGWFESLGISSNLQQLPNRIERGEKF